MASFQSPQNNMPTAENPPTLTRSAPSNRDLNNSPVPFRDISNIELPIRPLVPRFSTDWLSNQHLMSVLFDLVDVATLDTFPDLNRYFRAGLEEVRTTRRSGDPILDQFVAHFCTDFAYKIFEHLLDHPELDTQVYYIARTLAIEYFDHRDALVARSIESFLIRVDYPEWFRRHLVVSKGIGAVTRVFLALGQGFATRH